MAVAVRFAASHTMTDTHDRQTRPPVPRQPGLVSRLVGVLFTPHQTFGDVVAHPRWLGALIVVTVTMAGTMGWLVSTDIGQQAMLDTQVSFFEGIGGSVSDEMYDTLARSMENAAYFTAANLAISMPAVTLIIAGVVWTACNVLLGWHAPFRAMYAVVTHVGAVHIVQQAFSLPLNYARGVMTSPATLAAFFPMLETGSFAERLLSTIDLFIVWQLMVLAIGVAALYGRRTGPIATVFYALYAVIAVMIALVFNR